MQAKLEERVSNLEKSGIPAFRDFVATSALAYFANNAYQYDELACHCYNIADAFIEERKRYDAPTK